MDWLKLVHGEEPAAAAPFTPGDDVRVWFKISEQGKERLAQFEGVVLRVRGSAPSKTFTVRRVTFGEGVERMFPLDAKVIDHIEVLRRGKNPRSRLYFLRRVVKKTRLATDTRAESIPSEAPVTAGQPVDAAAETPAVAGGKSAESRGDVAST